MGTPWIPRALRVAPHLDEAVRPGPPRPRSVLLINPFYPKDPHASFGKHVLTPSLALTSIAGATPPDWDVTYWDENLLQGPPPSDPFPRVVGITVHLTFAERAYALARWYRDRGAVVVMGGLHALSCPEEVAPHADAIVVGEGVGVWPEVLRDIEAGSLRQVYRGSYRHPYREEPPPRRDLLPRRSFLTTTSLIATRGCHNRCGFCYLATDGLTMPYQVRDVEQVVAEFRDDGQPYGVFIDNNLGSRPEYLRALCRALRPLEVIWSAAVTIDVTDDPSLVREMALAGCTGVFVGFESLAGENLDDARKKTPRPEDYARRVRLLHEHGIQVNGSFVLGFDHDRPDVFARTVAWIEEARLECATFHILTPLPGHAAVPADGERGAVAAQGLVALRHGARRLPPPAHDAGGTGRGVCLVLPAAVLARVDLAKAPGGLAVGGAVPGDVVPLQAVEPALAPADPPPADGAGLASAGGVDAAPAPAVPSSAGVSPARLGRVETRRGGLRRGVKAR